MSGKILALLAILAFMLMLAGCAGSGNQPAQPNASAAPTVISETTGAGVLPPENQTAGQPAAEGQPSLPPAANCTLSLDPGLIMQGGSTEIKYEVYSKAETTFTFNCGDEEREISTGGLVRGSRICQFGQPGKQQVWIKANKAICAQATLDVAPKPLDARRCWIDESTVKRDLQSHYYEATVHWENFTGNATLLWICDYTTAKRTYRQDPVFGMQKLETISCDFPLYPKKDAIEVYVGDLKCGEIPTR